MQTDQEPSNLASGIANSCCFDRNVNCALNNKSVLYVDRSALAYRYYRYGDRPRVGDFTYSGFLFSDLSLTL